VIGKGPSLLDELLDDPMAAVERSTTQELAAVIARMRSERLGSTEWSRLLTAKGQLVEQLANIISARQSRPAAEEALTKLTAAELAARARQIADSCDAMVAESAPRTLPPETSVASKEVIPQQVTSEPEPLAMNSVDPTVLCAGEPLAMCAGCGKHPRTTDPRAYRPDLCDRCSEATAVMMRQLGKASPYL
jgi:hypothetical protein